MNGFDDEFMEFLRTNHPTDYLKACDNDVKPETLSRIFSDYSSYFSTWVKVPQSIRDAFQGKLPVEIMELAAQGKIDDLRRIEAHKPPEDKSVYIPPAPEEVMATEIFAAAFLAGYSEAAAYTLAQNHLFRESLREKALAGTLTEEEKRSWRLSRESDKKTIEKDWNEVQPEKMLIHLYAKFNRGHIKEDELMPRVVALMQKIEEHHRHEHLLAYIKSRPIQRKLAHFREEVLASLSQTVMHDIVIELPERGLRDKLSQHSQIRRLIDTANDTGGNVLTAQISDFVKNLKNSGEKLDLRSFGNDSAHPMPESLQQMFMVACCVHKVPYLSADGKKINPTDDFIKSLPQDIQSLVISREAEQAQNSKTGLQKRNDTSRQQISAAMINSGNTRSAG